MNKFKEWFFEKVNAVANRFGYVFMPSAEISIPAHVGADLHCDTKMSDGVKLLSMKVWTENEKPCAQHCYHKVRALNSHLNAIRTGISPKEHVDYTCCKCTHRLCESNWGDHGGAGTERPLGRKPGHKS